LLPSRPSGDEKKLILNNIDGSIPPKNRYNWAMDGCYVHIRRVVPQWAPG
jgi:hypothetical protein